MILGLDIWVYNFQVVLGSIPSQALFFFSSLSRVICGVIFQKQGIGKVVYGCWGVAVTTFFGKSHDTAFRLLLLVSTLLEFGGEAAW